MTRPLKTTASCKKCGDKVTCATCGEACTTSTPFSDWLRALPDPYSSRNYDNENLDYIWFHYRQGWFITIEEKRYGASSSYAQSDTHNIIAQILQHGCKNPVKTRRGVRPIEYRGHYIIRFEQTNPDDSKWVFINDNLSDRDGLMQLLSTGTYNAPETF